MRDRLTEDDETRRLYEEADAAFNQIMAFEARERREKALAMETREAMRVLGDLALDDLLDEAQQQAIRMAVAALADVDKREREELKRMRRWKAQAQGVAR